MVQVTFSTAGATFTDLKKHQKVYFSSLLYPYSNLVNQYDHIRNNLPVSVWNAEVETTKEIHQTRLNGII